MQVFSSDVYFTVGTNALLASQKEYYSDLVALVDLGHSFVVIDEHQHRNLKPNTEPVNTLLSNNFIRINKNITLSDLTHFLVSNLHTQNVYSTQEPLTHDEIDILRLCVSYSLKQIAIIKGIYELWFRRGISFWLGEKSGWLLVMGILDIILGLIFIFKIAVGASFIAVIFAPSESKRKNDNSVGSSP